MTTAAESTFAIVAVATLAAAVATVGPVACGSSSSEAPGAGAPGAGAPGAEGAGDATPAPLAYRGEGCLYDVSPPQRWWSPARVRSTS